MNSLNKTFLPTKDYKNRNWFIIDCKGQKLGRLATIIVALLKGKGKPQYHPSIDMGDYVILVNADSIILNEDSKHYIVNNPGRVGSALTIKNAIDSGELKMMNLLARIPHQIINLDESEIFPLTNINSADELNDLNASLS